MIRKPCQCSVGGFRAAQSGSMPAWSLVSDFPLSVAIRRYLRRIPMELQWPRCPSRQQGPARYSTGGTMSTPRRCPPDARRWMPERSASASTEVLNWPFEMVATAEVCRESVQDAGTGVQICCARDGISEFLSQVATWWSPTAWRSCQGQLNKVARWLWFARRQPTADVLY